MIMAFWEAWNWFIARLLHWVWFTGVIGLDSHSLLRRDEMEMLCYDMVGWS